MLEIAPAVSLSTLLCLAVIGAWGDIKSRTLPNWLVIITFLAGVGFTIWTAGLAALPSHLLHFAAALTIGIAFFAFKVWGAGDGKFYASVAVWLPIQEFFSLILAISIVGLFFTLAYFVRYRGKLFSKDNFSIPYGVAIGFGAVLACSRGVLW